MGYRSEVAIAVKTADYEKFIKGNPDLKELMGVTDKILTKENNTVTIIYWNSIKWYETFEDVQAMNRILDIIQENNHPYAFTRIGEDYNDIEFYDRGADDEYLGDYIYPTSYINM